MTIQADFRQGYPPAEAERGKFVVLDQSTITGLPSGSRGRYAMLTYEVGSSESAQTILGGLSSIELQISESTQELLSGLSAIEIVVPTLTNIEIMSTTLTNSRTVITFNQPIQRIEIFNTNPLSTVYMTLVPSAANTFATLTGTAIPIERYYATDFETSSIAIGATEASDVRIIGHF